jgi:hypothetical protein
MVRFQVLVDEAALMSLADGSGDADRQAQEPPRLHRRIDERSERLAARVLQHQHGPALFAYELNRPRRPGAVQLVSQLQMMGEAAQDGRRRAVASRRHNQHGAPLARSAKARGPIEDASAVVPQDMEALIQCR